MFFVQLLGFTDDLALAVTVNSYNTMPVLFMLRIMRDALGEFLRGCKIHPVGITRVSKVFNVPAFFPDGNAPILVFIFFELLPVVVPRYFNFDLDHICAIAGDNVTVPALRSNVWIISVETKMIKDRVFDGVSAYDFKIWTMNAVHSLYPAKPHMRSRLDNAAI